jgi:hypothetical protein
MNSGGFRRPEAGPESGQAGRRYVISRIYPGYIGRKVLIIRNNQAALRGGSRMPYARLVQEIAREFEEKAEHLREKRDREGRLNEQDETRLETTERVLATLRRSKSRESREPR